MFTIGAPPAPSSSSKVIAALSTATSPFLVEFCTALPVGREALKRLGGKSVDVATKKAAVSDFPDDKIIIPVGVNPQNLRNYTLYDILGLGGEWGAAADTDAIKRAYHKAVLMYHPDKAQYKTADGKEDRTVFLKIQEAFNVLCNETKRRAYDSQLPFDESIPTEEKVQKALAKGPHKEEKRHMQKENEKLAKKLKTKEMERLMALVNLAQKYDPRIVADKERIKQGKEAEKNAKESFAKRKAEEEAAAKEFYEKLEEEEKAKKAAGKMDKERLKKLQSKLRNTLRKQLRFTATLGLGSEGEYGILSAADVEILCQNCQLEDLTEITELLGGEAAAKENSALKTDAFAAVKAMVAKMNEINEQEAKKREAEEKAAAEKKQQGKKPAAGSAAVVEERTWAIEDYSMLAKCVASITNYMNVQLKPAASFSQEECLRFAYKLANNPQLVGVGK
eukprot:gene23927-32325_t